MRLATYGCCLPCLLKKVISLLNKMVNLFSAGTGALSTNILEITKRFPEVSFALGNYLLILSGFYRGKAYTL